MSTGQAPIVIKSTSSLDVADSPSNIATNTSSTVEQLVPNIDGQSVYPYLVSAQHIHAVDLTCAGTLETDDLTVVDDLTVTDDAAVGGDLAVTGDVSADEFVATTGVITPAISRTGDLSITATDDMNLIFGNTAGETFIVKRGAGATLTIDQDDKATFAGEVACTDLTASGNVDAANLDEAASTWTPTIGAVAPMTISGTPTIARAHYSIVGPWMFVALKASFTCATSATNTVTFTIPSGFTIADSSTYLPAKCYNNGDSYGLAGYCQYVNSTTIAVRFYDARNWALAGSNVTTFEVHGFFRHATS